MDTYRVGNHNPRNLYRDEQHFGVVFDPADGPLVVEALNGTARIEGPRGQGVCDCAGTDSDPISPTTGLAMDHHCDCCAVETAATVLGAYGRTKHAEACGSHGTSMDEFYRQPADSCTCDVLAPKPDPTCIVHQGRRARGPKPPPLGPGCICDGSGRTCPRHGAVM